MRFKITFEVDSRGIKKNTRITEIIEYGKIPPQYKEHYTLRDTVQALKEAQRIAKDRTNATSDEIGYVDIWEVVKVDELK